MLVLSDCANNSRLVSAPTCEPCGFHGGIGVPAPPWPRRAPHLCPRRCTDTLIAAHSRLCRLARSCMTQSSCRCSRRLWACSRTLCGSAHGTGRTAVSGRTAVLAERLCLSERLWWPPPSRMVSARCTPRTGSPPHAAWVGKVSANLNGAMYTHRHHHTDMYTQRPVPGACVRLQARVSVSRPVCPSPGPCVRLQARQQVRVPQVRVPAVRPVCTHKACTPCRSGGSRSRI